MNKDTAKKIVRKAQAFHRLDHQSAIGRPCKKPWRSLNHWYQYNAMGRIFTNHNWKQVDHWKPIGAQVDAILRGLA